jgi:dCMP deaminase
VRVPTSDQEADHTFEDVETLLHFVTKRWREQWVTNTIWDEAVLDALQHRPFFLLVSVDAPITLRWERFRKRCAQYKLPPPTLEEFVLRNDEHLYLPGKGIAPLINRAHLRLLNSVPSLQNLYKALTALDLPNRSRIRPNWDQYFMQLAALAAQRSNCMKRRVGCVLVQDRRVISTGYNGTPRGMRDCNEGGCKFPVSLDKSCIGLHGKVGLNIQRRCTLQQRPKHRD